MSPYWLWQERQAPVGGDAEANWQSQSKGGMFQQACDPNGLYNYTPSHCMLRRESPVPNSEDDDLWVFKFVFP